jgi:predicted small lipoprotein YifL
MLLGFVAFGAVASCGQKGPLYLPDDARQVVRKPQSEQTKAPPAPATQPGTPPAPEKSKETGSSPPK